MVQHLEPLAKLWEGSKADPGASRSSCSIAFLFQLKITYVAATESLHEVGAALWGHGWLSEASTGLPRGQCSLFKHLVTPPPSAVGRLLWRCFGVGGPLFGGVGLAPLVVLLVSGFAGVLRLVSGWDLGGSWRRRSSFGSQMRCAHLGRAWVFPSASKLSSPHVDGRPHAPRVTSS